MMSIAHPCKWSNLSIMPLSPLLPIPYVLLIYYLAVNPKDFRISKPTKYDVASASAPGDPSPSAIPAL